MLLPDIYIGREDATLMIYIYIYREGGCYSLIYIYREGGCYSLI